MAPQQLSLISKCLTTEPPNNTVLVVREFFIFLHIFSMALCFKTETTDNSKEINPIRHLELLIDEVTIHIFHLKMSVTLIYNQLQIA